MKKLMHGMTAVACVAVMAVAANTFAAETAPHQGAFVGTGVMSGFETGPFNRAGGGAVARVGYGVTDNVLLYLDNNYFYTRDSGANFNFYDAQAKVQYFPWGNVYANAGAGLSVGRVGAVGLSSTKLGYATSSAVGYEWRPKDQLAVSAEAGMTYKRISGTNFYTPSAGVRLDWYF